MDVLLLEIYGLPTLGVRVFDPTTISILIQTQIVVEPDLNSLLVGNLDSKEQTCNFFRS